MQKHLFHNISDANGEVENLTEREVTLMLVCYLPVSAVRPTGLLFFRYFHREYKSTPAHI